VVVFRMPISKWKKTRFLPGNTALALRVAGLGPFSEFAGRSEVPPSGGSDGLGIG